MTTKCQRCISLTKSNTQCKRNSCKWSPMCFQHTMVYTGISTIANSGDGVFAKEEIPNKTKIANYKVGTIKMNKEDVLNTNDRSYIWKYSNDEYYNGNNGVIAGKFNNCRKQNQIQYNCKNNAKINKNGNIVTTKKILKDKEIFVSGYGNSYIY